MKYIVDSLFAYDHNRNLTDHLPLEEALSYYKRKTDNPNIAAAEQRIKELHENNNHNPKLPFASVFDDLQLSRSI